MIDSPSATPKAHTSNQRHPGLIYHLIGVVLGVAMIGGGVGLYEYRTARPPDPPGVQSVFPPEKVPSFALEDQNGKPFTLDRLRGKWTIMFFGYTHCPDFCPTTLTGLNGAFHRLEREAPRLAATTQVVFVSVDPFRDTPRVLSEFVAHFNKHFIGVTGPATQLHRLADPLGASYDYSDPVSHAIFPDSVRPGIKEYVVDHSSGLYIFDDKARAAAWVLPPHSPTRIVSVYTHIRRLNE